MQHVLRSLQSCSKDPSSGLDASLHALRGCEEFLRAGGNLSLTLLEAVSQVHEGMRLGLLSEPRSTAPSTEPQPFGGPKDIFVQLPASVNAAEAQKQPTPIESLLDDSDGSLLAVLQYTLDRVKGQSPAADDSNLRDVFRSSTLGQSIANGGLLQRVCERLPEPAAKPGASSSSETVPDPALDDNVQRKPTGPMTPFAAVHRRAAVEVVHKFYALYPDSRPLLRQRIVSLLRRFVKQRPTGATALDKGGRALPSISESDSADSSSSSDGQQLRDLSTSGIGTPSSTLPPRMMANNSAAAGGFRPPMGRAPHRGASATVGVRPSGLPSRVSQGGGARTHVPTAHPGSMPGAPAARAQYLSPAEVSFVDPLTVLIPLLESIVAGTPNVTVGRDRGLFLSAFEVLLKMLACTEMIDEFTGLLSVYSAELSRCLVAFLRSDPDAMFLDRAWSTMCEIFVTLVESMGRSKVAILVLRTFEDVVVACHEYDLPVSLQQIFALMNVLCGRYCLESPNFAVMQRGLSLLQKDAVLDLLILGPRLHRWTSDQQAAHAGRLVTSLATGFATMFSRTTQLHCHKALLRVSERHAAVRTWTSFRSVDSQCQQWAAIAEAEERQKTIAMSTPRDDLSFNRLAWNKDLGVGAFGTVKSAVVIEHGQPQHTWPEFAVKTVQKGESSGPALDLLSKEIDLLRRCNPCSYIVRFIASFEDERRSFLVMELAEGGDLFDLLRVQGSCDPIYARYVAAGTSTALKFLHSLGYIHSDVKPENLLRMKDGSIRLGDCGSAVELASIQREAVIPLTGTADYTCPELCTAALQSSYEGGLHHIPGRLLGPGADFWSLGCVVYQLLEGKVPFLTATIAQSAPAVIFAHIAKMAPITGPLFTQFSDVQEDLAEAREATRRLLDCDPIRRLSNVEVTLAMFLDWPSDKPVPASARGAISSAKIDVQLKQRKFSMMATQMTQFIRETASAFVLEVIPFLEGY